VWKKYPDALDAIILRLKGVVIDNRNALELVNQHDSENTLFYADPPYVHSTRNTRKAYRFEMGDSDHVELAEKLNRVRGPVIVSGYDCNLYNELYEGWDKCQRLDFADGTLPRTEVLWMKGVDEDLFSNLEREGKCQELGA
jgi:DNA adenine methylase